MAKPRIFGCPVEFAINRLGGKWKAVILARLKDNPMRYGELRRQIPDLSDKMLTQRLHDLSEAGLIVLRGEDGTPRYALSAHGETLRPVLQALYAWGEAMAAEFGVTFATVPDRLPKPTTDQGNTR